MDKESIFLMCGIFLTVIITLLCLTIVSLNNDKKILECINLGHDVASCENAFLEANTQD